MAKTVQVLFAAALFLLISPDVNGQPFLNSLAVLFRARPPWPTTFPSAKFTPIPPPLLNPPGSSQGILVAHPISPSSSTAYESINDGLKSQKPDTIESVQSVQNHPPQPLGPSPQQNFIPIPSSPTISPLIPIYPQPIPLFQNGQIINQGQNNGPSNSGSNNQHINSKDSAVYPNTLPSTLIASPTTLQGSYALPDPPTTVSNPNYGILLENTNSKGSQKKSKFRGNAWKPVTSADLNSDTKNSLQGNSNDGNVEPKNSNKESTRQLKNIKEFRPSPQLNSYLETTLISDYGSHINANNGYNSGHYDGTHKDAQDNPGFHPTDAKTPKLESGFRPISFDQYASNYGSTATSQHYTNSHQQYYNPWSIPYNGNNPQQNPGGPQNPTRDNNDNAARDTRGDTHDTRDTRQESRDTRHDSRDTRHDSRDTRHDSRDTRHDSRDTRQDSRDTRQDSRDTRHDSRDTRHDSHDSRDIRSGTRDAAPSSNSKGSRRNKPLRQDRQIVTGSVSVSMKNSGEDESLQEGSSSEEDSQRFFRTRGKKKSSVEQLSKKKPRHRLSSKGKWDHGISSTTASSELVEDWLPPGIQIQKKSDRKKYPIFTDIKPMEKPKPLPQGTFKLPEKCEKFNRFGFCPVTKQYPLDAAEKIASRCTALMSHLIAPLPKMDVQYDVAKLKVQNQNGVTVKRPTGWSWRSFNGKPVCDTDELAILPGWARNEKGDWMIILQTKIWQQKAHISLCSPVTVPCQGQACSTSTGNKPSSPGRGKNDDGGQEAKNKNCVQRFSAQRLAVFDPDNPDRCPVVHSVFLPSACVCLTSTSNPPNGNDQGTIEGDKQSYGQPPYSRFPLRQPLFSSHNDDLMQTSEEDMVGSYPMDSPESGAVTTAPMTHPSSDASSTGVGQNPGSLRHQSNSIEDPRSRSGTFMVITKKFSTSESSKETSDMPQDFMPMNETQQTS